MNSPPAAVVCLPIDALNLKRCLLYSLVVSVILGAGLGVFAVLRGHWGWFELRVILSTVTIAAASLCGLACDLSRVPKGLNLLPRVGLGLTLLAAALTLCGMWTDASGEGFWKTTVSLSIFAVAAVHVCLLSIARLARRFSWVYLLATQVIFGLAALLVAMIVGPMHEPAVVQIVAILAIFVAALSLIIPLLHRISRSTAAAGQIPTQLEAHTVAEIDAQIARLHHQIGELENLKHQLVSCR